MALGDEFLLTKQAVQDLKREMNSYRQDLVNLKRNYAHVSTRRHEAVYMPAKVIFAEFDLSQCIQGFSGSGSSGFLDSTHLIGYLGSYASHGDPDAIGIEYQTSETTPGTNGNYLISKAGLYKIQVQACPTIETVSGSFTDTDTYTTSAYTGHDHTVDVKTYREAWESALMLTMILLRKPSGSSIANYTDDLGNYRFVTTSGGWTSAAWGLSLCADWYVNLDANDKLAFKVQISETTTGRKVIDWGRSLFSIIRIGAQSTWAAV